MRSFLTITAGVVFTVGISMILWTMKGDKIGNESVYFGNTFQAEQNNSYTASELIEFKNKHDKCALFKEPVSDKVWFHAFLKAKKISKRSLHY